MKKHSLVRELRPCAHGRYLALPLFGAVLEELCKWLHQQGYTAQTLVGYLTRIAGLDRWLRRRGRNALADVTPEDLRLAYDDHPRRPRRQDAGAIRVIGGFLSEHGLIAAEETPKLSRIETELIAFGSYLRDIRGLCDSTVYNRQGRLRFFLKFIGFDRCPSAIRTLKLDAIEGFLRVAAKTNCRASLVNVVAALRSYLKRQHSEGVMGTALHQQIPTPRLYRLEQLPRSLPWEQVAALLKSIDRSQAEGLRDFTVLYLAAHYGLRSSELKRLKLEDVDWRAGTLKVTQTKNKNALVLPLTDEAGDVLCRYLREGRPVCEHRAMFLRHMAPEGPLGDKGTWRIMQRRLRLSGLKLQCSGAHALRHSFAVHMLRQGVSMKAIGDTLGHRSLASTSIYLRLAVDDLRAIGLAVPRGGSAAALLPDGWMQRLVKVNTANATPLRHIGFQSTFAAFLDEYLTTCRAMGRGYRRDERILLAWDNFMRSQYPAARHLDARIFGHWAQSLAHLNPNTHRRHVLSVRRFLVWHQRTHPKTYLPDPAFFPKRIPYPTPRLVSPAEMARLLATVQQLPVSKCNPLRAQTMRLGLILLFCCGLRRGELLRLRLTHFDAREAILRIEATKFYKSRLVPLSPSVTKELCAYLKLRQKRRLPMAPDSALIWSGAGTAPDGRYGKGAFTESWQRTCLSVGVLDARGRPPRVHHLRHSFAVAALHRWYVAGHDPQSKLPHLATYLGHVSAASTHCYLHLTSGLREAVNRRFHNRFGHLLGKEGVS
jgi:site-specific recombinase XerD